MSTRDLSAADASVFELIQKAAEQYEQYVELTRLGASDALCLDETWDHDPNASLSITVDAPSR
ncbi:MAG: hypothetical protein JWN04_979 [Myxococcaceae bacterium]|nr:hypothetical protein [Myxococcaceae bacterium]